MKRFVNLFVAICLLLSLYSSETFAKIGFVDKSTGKPVDLSDGKGTYNVYPKDIPDDSSNNSSSNNSSSNTSSGYSSGSGGSSGGSYNSALRAASVEPNRFIGLYKNFALKQYPAEEYYIINTIKEGKYVGQLRVRNRNDKMLYGFYKIKSMYSNDINVYFFDLDARIHVGFVADAAGDIYYFTSDGTMLTGKRNIGGIEYEFNTDGALKTEYLNVLKTVKPEVYCVNSSEWQKQANGKWKLLKKNFYGEILGYYTNEVTLRYDSTKNEIQAYMFDKDGIMVDNDAYLKEGVLCTIDRAPSTTGQIINLVVSDMSAYLNSEIFSSEVQLANFVAKWIKR